MIRKYKTEDTEALITIWDNAEALAHPFLPTAIRDQVRKDMRNMYLPNAETWVLEEDGVLVGFIAMIDTEIGGLFLDPSQQGKGLGSRDGRSCCCHQRAAYRRGLQRQQDWPAIL